jgi:hypothetical protein
MNIIKNKKKKRETVPCGGNSKSWHLVCDQSPPGRMGRTGLLRA